MPELPDITLYLHALEPRVVGPRIIGTLYDTTRLALTRWIDRLQSDHTRRASSYWMPLK